jgi:hypothetical protein
MFNDIYLTEAGKKIRFAQIRCFVARQKQNYESCIVYFK